jgi:hypothetical protein
MTAHSQAQPANSMAKRLQLLGKLDRADLPQETKASLRLSLGALFDAYEEDDDPQKIAPDLHSFKHLLEFLSHPYHRLWASPAIAVNPEGMFVSIWEDPGVHRWVLDFYTNGDIEHTYLKTDTDGGISQATRKDHVGGYLHPPYPVAHRR